MKIATQKLNKYYHAQRKKLTHEQIAKTLGISTRYLYDLLRGDKTPTDKAEGIEKVVTTIRNDWNKEAE
jgi:transcriptional regulator with XRE-family HTH domain